MVGPLDAEGLQKHLATGLLTTSQQTVFIASRASGRKVSSKIV